MPNIVVRLREQHGSIYLQARKQDEPNNWWWLLKINGDAGILELKTHVDRSLGFHLQEGGCVEVRREGTPP